MTSLQDPDFDVLIDELTGAVFVSEPTQPAATTGKISLQRPDGSARPLYPTLNREQQTMKPMRYRNGDAIFGWGSELDHDREALAHAMLDAMGFDLDERDAAAPALTIALKTIHRGRFQLAALELRSAIEDHLSGNTLEIASAQISLPYREGIDFVTGPGC